MRRPRSLKTRVLFAARVFMLLFSTVMSIVQVVLAIMWGPHWLGFSFGLALAIGSAFTLAALLGRFMKSPFHPVVRVFWISFLAVLFILSMFWLTIYTANHNGRLVSEGFPKSCGDRDYCIRVTLNGTNDNRDGFEPPIIHGRTVQEVENIVKGFISSHMTKETSANNTYTHSIYVNVFFGLIDDFYTDIVTVNDTTLSVDMQSFSRAGTNDFGSNKERVHAFLKYLNARV